MRDHHGVPRLSGASTAASALFALAMGAMAAGFGFSAPVRQPAAADPAVTRYPNAYGSPQQFMEGLYAADRGVDPPAGYRIRAAIVPHHLTAAASIASGIAMLKGQRFSKVLLLSPDHFGRCPTVLCTTNAAYDTFFGKTEASAGAVRTLLASPLATDAPELFRREHGIYAVAPFIARYFPGVAVTPVALSQRLPWKAGRRDVLDLIAAAIDDDTMLVVSSDFSHYLPLPDADERDERTAEALFSKDIDGIAGLANPDQSDCPNCLWVLASLADARGYYVPSVVLHTNSATLLGDASARSTTSHFSMVWYENDPLGPDDLAVAGDIGMDRATEPPALTEAARSWWAGDGPRLVNLEGPLAERCPPRAANPYLFCVPAAAWRGAKGLATHWGVMNNHMFDLGASGLDATERVIREAGEVPVTPAPWTGDGLRLYAVTTLMNPVADSAKARLPDAMADLERSLAEPHPDGLSVVLVHAGTEYSALAADADGSPYERLIDAGADAVVASHGHMPGDMRVYHGKPIFRGLGNFLFDQKDRVATSTARLVRLRKADGRVLFESALFRMP